MRKLLFIVLLLAGAVSSYGQTGVVDSATIKIGKYLSPTGNLWLEIYNESGSDPNVMITNGRSDTISIASLGGVTQHTLHFDSSPSVSEGTQYYLIVKGDNVIDGSNYMPLRFQTTDVYPNGGVKLWNGSAWSSIGSWDMHFIIYGHGTSPPGTILETQDVDNNTEAFRFDTARTWMGTGFKVTITSIVTRLMLGRRRW